MMDCLAFENQSKSNQILKILKMWIVVLKEKKKKQCNKKTFSLICFPKLSLQKTETTGRHKKERHTPVAWYRKDDHAADTV